MTITHTQLERLEALLRDRFKAGGATYAFACRDFIDECGQDLLALARAVLDAPEGEVCEGGIGSVVISGVVPRFTGGLLLAKRVRIVATGPVEGL